MVSILERPEPMVKENESEDGYQHIIDWLNETFAPIGLEPITKMPKGNPDSGYQCPIALVLNYGLDGWEPEGEEGSGVDQSISSWFVGRIYIDSPRGIRAFDIPEFVSEFIQDFDAHRYPDLIDPDLDENGYQNGCPCEYCMPNVDGAKE